MGGLLSTPKATPQAATSSSMMISRPVAEPTITIIKTILQSETPSIMTIMQTQTLVETIIISVTPTVNPTTAAPSNAPEPAVGVAPTAVPSSAATSTATEETGDESAEEPSSSSKVSGSRTMAAGAATQSAQRAGAAVSPIEASAAAAQATPQAQLVQQNVKVPIAPPEAILGGIPDKKVDLPVTIVFLIFFVTGAITHMGIHEVNGKKGHKFHLSDLMFDFCMVRTVTTTMRIVWIFRPNNNSIVLAALIFQGAGTTVIFAVNAFLAQRIVRAVHPKVGWSGPARLLFRFIIASVPGIIFWNIITNTLAVFLIKPQQVATIHDLIVFGSSWTLFLCSIPITFLLLAAAFPTSSPPEKFGKGGLHPKILILVLASAVLTIGAVIRLYTTVVQRTIEDPGAINSKAVFYITGYMLEIMVVAGYVLARFDLRFYVPDGCTGPGDYNRGMQPKDMVPDDKEKLIDEKDMGDNSRMSDESFGYTGNAPMPPPPMLPQAYIVEDQMRPSSPSGSMQGPFGSMEDGPPRRPPRSMRWETKPRISNDNDVI